jgi:cytoskeletal protein CcmA (bactofilin family)
MSDEPRRRLADKLSTSPTLIGAGTTLTGNLNCEGDLVVGGAAIGDSVVRGAYTLSEGGTWEGKLQAKNAVIAGEVRGQLTITEKLEIRKSARVHGTLAARSIAIAQGAVIDGEMSVTSGAGVVHYDEKRGT